MRFPEVPESDKQRYHEFWRKIWLDQRADKSGNKDDTYYAATWHIPLEVLIEYSERKLEFPKANFPYYMSKEKGVKYQFILP